MEERRCATCRYWKTLGPVHHDPRAELNPKTNAWEITSHVDWNTCTLISQSLGEDWKGAAVFPDADCDGNTDVFTAPDFGCVRWTPDAGT